MTARLKGIARYPVKGLNGEDLMQADLQKGAGIPGDRRFAFGIDATVDDGVWRSSRSYLINAVNDNLLKYHLVSDDAGLLFTSPGGETLRVEPDDPASIEVFNNNLASFLQSVSNGGSTPRFIERNPKQGPSGHWDFPDSEILMVNLATINELSKLWNLDIDPRRFRANLIIDGLPAWAEFGLYGAEFSVGGAKLEVLRPARRCAATTVNPDTGERDIEIPKLLASDYAHGYFGVYARVSNPGRIMVGDDICLAKRNALSQTEAVCEIAPDISQWPKVAECEVVNSGEASLICKLSKTSAWPLTEPDAKGRMRMNLGPGSTFSGNIVSASTDDVFLGVQNECSKLHQELNQNPDSKAKVIVSGPFGGK